MEQSRHGVPKQVATAVLVSLITILLVTIEGWVWAGGLIAFLGGLTVDNFNQKAGERLKKELREEWRKELSPVDVAELHLPPNAVVAFDDSKCPDGWTNFSEAEGLVIVGAGGDYKYRVPNGQKDILLTDAHMPEHHHTFTDLYHAESPVHRPPGTVRIDIPRGDGAASHDTDNVGWGLPGRRTNPSGHARDKRAAHTNMQPYLPLSFCKRN